MAKAIGIGGVFFKCRDKNRLASWYAKHLYMKLNSLGGVEFNLKKLPKGAYCVWGPFDHGTTYFAPSRKEFMINLIVDDVAAALEQVKRGRATVVGEVRDYEYGRFGWFIDPEGNKIELWQPPSHE